MSMTAAVAGGRLQGKVAVVLGAGGEVGAHVAAEFARQGALLYLSGRTGARVRAASEAIAAGRVAGVAEVDALDEVAVEAHMEHVIRENGRIDVVFNATGPQAVDYGNATPTMELTVEKFMLPINTIIASQFITARAAARHMTPQGSGAIVFLSATPSQGSANTSAIGAAYGALESLTRSLAVDLGPRGVRVVCVRSMGMAGTRVMRQTFELGGGAMGRSSEQLEAIVTSRALLGRSPTLAETAGIISFLASDEARTLTGTVVNSSCGQVLG